MFSPIPSFWHASYALLKRNIHVRRSQALIVTIVSDVGKLNNQNKLCVNGRLLGNRNSLLIREEYNEIIQNKGQ